MKWRNAVFLIFLFLLMTTGCSEVRSRENVDSGDQRQRTSFGEARDVDFTILHEGLERAYRVHLPPSYDGSTKTPVVIFVHGGGGDIRSGSRDGLDTYSDTLGFILVTPAATNVLRGPLGSRWNGGEWSGGQCCGSADDVGFISKMIEEIQQDFAVDEQRIYATGISNGGLMTNRLACELSDKIAAIAVVAPTGLMENCSPSRPVPVMIIYGTEDPAYPLDGSLPRGIFSRVPYDRVLPHDMLHSWLQMNGCPPDTMRTSTRGAVTCTSYQGENDSEVLFLVVEGMGHTWPSGKQYFFARVIGRVTHELSMEDIWAFFQEHPKG
jgi:polyhydroxybutyrate depolymerase